MNTEPQTSIEEIRTDIHAAVNDALDNADGDTQVAQVVAEANLAQTVAAAAVVEAHTETTITKTELEEAREQLLWETNRRVELEAEASRLSLSLETMTAQVADLTQQVILLTSQSQEVLQAATETIQETTPEILEVETEPTPPPHTDTPQTGDQQKSEAESQAPAVIAEVQEVLSEPLIRFL